MRWDAEMLAVKDLIERGRLLLCSVTSRTLSGLARTLSPLAITLGLVFGLGIRTSIAGDDIDEASRSLIIHAMDTGPMVVADTPFQALSGCAPPLVWATAIKAFDASVVAQRDDHRNEQIGLRFGGHYAMMARSYSSAGMLASGVLRGSAQWNRQFGERGSRGSFTITVDHRHEVLDNHGLADLSDRIGYIGQPSLFFNDTGTAVLDLHWRQRFNEGRSAIVAGRFDPNDYLNMLGYAHPWASFSNAAVLFDASLAVPDSSWGIAGMHFLNDEWYVLGIVNDVNGSQDDNFEFFRGGARFFALGEIGWSPARSDRCTTNWNLSVWRADPRVNEDQRTNRGILFSASWKLAERWGSYVRGGLSSGVASTYNESISFGLLHENDSGTSLLGVGYNIGKLSTRPSTYQKTGELFYRVQLTENLTITPSVQLLIDPAMRKNRSRTWLFGFRVQNRF